MFAHVNHNYQLPISNFISYCILHRIKLHMLHTIYPTLFNAKCLTLRIRNAFIGGTSWSQYMYNV